MRTTLLLILAFALFLLPGCWTHQYYYYPFVTASDSLFSISESDIRSAIAASPRLTDPFSVALYSPTYAHNPLLDSLRDYPFVSSAIEMSPVLIEGERYLHRENRTYGDLFTMPGNSAKLLRLGASMYRADVLVSFTTYQYLHGEPNIWGIISYPLVLPMFFIPGVDCELDTQVHVFVFDVRNGYLYGSYVARGHDVREYQTLGYPYSPETRSWKSEQVDRLVPDISEHLRTLLGNPEFYLRSVQDTVSH